jgi:hypothetical protein
VTTKKNYSDFKDCHYCSLKKKNLQLQLCFCMSLAKALAVLTPHFHNGKKLTSAAPAPKRTGQAVAEKGSARRYATCTSPQRASCILGKPQALCAPLVVGFCALCGAARTHTNTARWLSCQRRVHGRSGLLFISRPAARRLSRRSTDR